MKRIIFLFLALLIQGCNKNNYYYLSPSELAGVTLQPEEDVHKMKLRVQAKAKCTSEVIVFMNARPFIFKFEKELDTIILRDWYQTPVFIKTEMDSCVIGDPKVGVQFFDL